MCPSLLCPIHSSLQRVGGCQSLLGLPTMTSTFSTVLAVLVLAASTSQLVSSQFSSTLTCQAGASGTDVIQLCTGSGTLAMGEQVPLLFGSLATYLFFLPEIPSDLHP